VPADTGFARDQTITITVGQNTATSTTTTETDPGLIFPP
jgi:hypothetical protein